MTIVSIPVLPQVKALLVSLHGPEPLKAHENNILGKEIESFLLSYSQTEDCRKKLIGETIEIEISSRIAPYFKHFRHALDLGSLFEKQFHMVLFTYVDAQMELGTKQELALRNFYKRHNIPADIYDQISARMSLIRFRTRVQRRRQAEA